MINASEAHTIAELSFEERQRPKIKADWDKVIKSAACYGHHSIEQYVPVYDDEHANLICDILKENGFRIVARRVDSKHYMIEAHW